MYSIVYVDSALSFVAFEGSRAEAIEHYTRTFDSIADERDACRYACEVGTARISVQDGAGRVACRPKLPGWFREWYLTPHDWRLISNVLCDVAPGRRLRVFRLLATDAYVVWMGPGAYVQLQRVWVHLDYADARSSMLCALPKVLSATSRALVSLVMGPEHACEVGVVEVTMPPQSDYPPAREGDLQQYARGPWQLSRIRGNTVTFPHLKGRARYYWLSYWISLQHMLERMERAGFEVIPVEGPQGGRPKRWVIFDAR